MATPANLMPDGLLARAGTSREGYDRQQRMLVRRLTTLQQLAHHPPPVGSLKTRNRNAKRSGVARAKVHVPRVLVRRKKQRKESGGGALTVDYDIASLHGFMDEMSKGSREQDHQEGMDGSGDEDEEVVNPHDPGTLLRGEDDGGDVYMEPTKAKAAAAGGKTAQARTGPTLYQAFHGNLLLVNKLTEFSTNLTVADMTTLWREQGQTRDLGTLTEEEMRKLFLACFRVTFPALYLRTGELEFLRFLDGIDLAQARKHGIIVIMIQCPPPSGYTPMSVNEFGKPLDNGPTSRLTRQVVAILQRVRPGVQCVVIDTFAECVGKEMRERRDAASPDSSDKKKCFPSEDMLYVAHCFERVIDVFLECLGIQRAATFASGKCAHVAKGTIPNAGFSPVSTFHFSNLRPPVEFLKTNMAAVERPDRIESSPIFPCVHLTHPLSVARCAGRPTSAIKGPKSLKIGKDMALDKLELKAVENVYNEMILVAPLKRRFTWKEATKFLNAQECKDASQLWHRANKKREQIVRIDRGMLSWYSPQGSKDWKRPKTGAKEGTQAQRKVRTRAAGTKYQGGKFVGMALNALVKRERAHFAASGRYYTADQILARSPQIHGYGLKSVHRGAWIAGNTMIGRLSLLGNLKKIMYEKIAKSLQIYYANRRAGIKPAAPDDMAVQPAVAPAGPGASARSRTQDASSQTSGRAAQRVPTQDSAAPPRLRPLNRGAAAPDLDLISSDRMDELEALTKDELNKLIQRLVKLGYRILVPYLRAARDNKTERTTLGNHWDRFVRWAHWPSKVPSGWQFVHNYRDMSKSHMLRLLRALETNQTHLLLRSEKDVEHRVKQGKVRDSRRNR